MFLLPRSLLPPALRKLITHYSLLITHYSLLITHYSLLITHYSSEYLRCGKLRVFRPERSRRSAVLTASSLL
ncbi:MAG: hypothetical protein F6K47_22820 [Symploca sp. SIO2E6]|nr:hypothetical protein [Symploca sp. SIO2E6]